MSFESDAVRAFSGILNSLESEYGEAIWGVPRRSFAKGLTWSLSDPDPDLRRDGFPSWSWAGWKGNTGTRLVFQDVFTAKGGIFAIEWYYHRQTENGSYELAAVDDSPPPLSKVLARRSIATTTTTSNPTLKPQGGSLFSFGSGSNNSTSLFGTPARTPSETTKPEIEEKKPIEEEQPTQREINRKKNYTWYVTGHPGEPDYVKQDHHSLTIHQCHHSCTYSASTPVPPQLLSIPLISKNVLDGENISHSRLITRTIKTPVEKKRRMRIRYDYNLYTYQEVSRHLAISPILTMMMIKGFRNC
jgi:hypothetical protein